MSGHSGHHESFDMMERVARNIETYGWHVMKVLEEGDLPPFAYTIGLYQTFKQPEVIVFGLPLELMSAMLNILGGELKEGKRYESDVRSPDFLEGYDCVLH
ncbi:MAG: DUF4262 domain-containing protein, partial [Deinococcus sp.]